MAGLFAGQIFQLLHPLGWRDDGEAGGGGGGDFGSPGEEVGPGGGAVVVGDVVDLDIFPLSISISLSVSLFRTLALTLFCGLGVCVLGDLQDCFGGDVDRYPSQGFIEVW